MLLEARSDVARRPCVETENGCEKRGRNHRLASLFSFFSLRRGRASPCAQSQPCSPHTLPHHTCGLHAAARRPGLAWRAAACFPAAPPLSPPCPGGEAVARTGGGCGRYGMRVCVGGERNGRRGGREWDNARSKPTKNPTFQPTAPTKSTLPPSCKPPPSTRPTRWDRWMRCCSTLSG